MDAADGLLLNIGTGVETSVNELYLVMAASVGGPDEPEHAPARPGEIRRSALNPAAAAGALGWTPTTDLADGVADTLSWFDSR